MVRLPSALVCAAALVVGASPALARKEQTFTYPYTRVWEAAVRLVRVDFASPISERNRDDGYFLFEFTHDEDRYPGSVEVVRVGETGVRVVIQIPGLPSYVERMLLDRLEKKLVADYGEPPVPVLTPAAGAKDAPAGDGTKTEKKGEKAGAAKAEKRAAR